MKAHEEPARPAPRALELPRRAPALVAFRSRGTILFDQG